MICDLRFTIWSVCLGIFDGFTSSRSTMCHLKSAICTHPARPSLSRKFTSPSFPGARSGMKNPPRLSAQRVANCHAAFGYQTHRFEQLDVGGQVALVKANIASDSATDGGT